MTLLQILHVLRARRAFILSCMAAAMAVAAFISVVAPNIYKAGTSLVLNYKGVDPVSGLSMPPQLMAGYVATQIDIIRSKNVALKVVDELRLAQQPAYQEAFMDATDGRGELRDWIADTLLDRIRILPSRESSVMELTYKHKDPVFAATVVNAFARQYLRTAIELNAEPKRQVASYFTAQLKVLRDNLEAAQNRYSQYQEQKGIVNADRSLDVETMRLNELSAQLVTVQAQRIDADARRKEAQSGGEMPEVMNNVLLQNLKASLAAAEGRYANLSRSLEDGHPRMQAAKAEVDQLRAELNRHVQAATAGLGKNARALEAREAELREAVAAQKARVLELNRARDQVAVLGKEVDSARSAYDTAVQRLNQTSLEGQANQADVAILNPAIAPANPWFPVMSINLAVAAFLGMFGGTVVAFTREWFGRRLRSSGDLAAALQAPVLATFNWRRPASAPVGRLSQVLALRNELN